MSRVWLKSEDIEGPICEAIIGDHRHDIERAEMGAVLARRRAANAGRAPEEEQIKSPLESLQRPSDALRSLVMKRTDIY